MVRRTAWESSYWQKLAGSGMDVIPWSLVLQMEVHSYKLEMLLSHELIYKHI